VFGNTFGMIVTMPVTAFLFMILIIFGVDISSTIVIVVPSILVGFFQWLVLRTHIINARQWILASFIGLSIGMSAIRWIFPNFNLLNMPSWQLFMKFGGVGAIIGTVLGTAQWFLLRKHVRYSSLWILGNIISWSLSINTYTLGWTSFMGSGADDQGFFIIVFAIIILEIMFIYSVFTGIVLIWMLGNPLNKFQAEIIEQLKAGDIMGAIRVHRSTYNSNFEEARQAVEMLRAKLG
jgi:hypothetical protein